MSNTNQAFGPYSPFRIANGFVYTSGQVGVDQKTMTADPSIEAQVEQALKNLSGVLESAGSSINHVVKTTVFLTNMDHYAKMNEVYAVQFPKNGPARSAIAVAELPRVADVPLLAEIEAVASLEQ